MSTNIKPQKSYRIWTQENLNLAINAVNKGLHTSRAASIKYGIPRTTLERRLKLLGRERKRLERDPVLGKYEKDLEDFVLNLQKDGMKWTITDLRRTAFDFAEKYKIKNKDCSTEDKRLVNNNWIDSFLSKHPNLSLTKESQDTLSLNKLEVEKKVSSSQVQNFDRCRWTEDQLIQAIESVNKGICSCRSASKKFGIPRTTLIRHIKEGTKEKKRLGRLPIFGSLENKLKEFLLNEQNNGNTWSMTELRKVAFHFAETHNINHKFNKQKGLASYEWVHAFISRHPEIIVETRQYKRSIPDSFEEAYEFCDLLQIVLEEGDEDSDIFKHINAKNT